MNRDPHHDQKVPSCMKRTTEPRPVTILRQLPVRLVLDVVEMRESYRVTFVCPRPGWVSPSRE
jgi:hypothetical protein